MNVLLRAENLVRAENLGPAVTRCRDRVKWLLATTALCAFVITTPIVPSIAAETAPAWKPQASEKLVKLPATTLKKSLDYDFARSELGQAIRDVDSEIGFKTMTLSDLQSAIEQSDGEVHTELRHQFLAEKRDFIELVSRKNDFRKRHLKTRLKTLDRVLNGMAEKKASLTPARLELVSQQEAARTRFSASMDKVDVKLLTVSAVPESKYAVDYAKNLTAIESLVYAIERHPMNAMPEFGDVAMSKQDYVRQMMADTQASMALLQQEENILGYMAKLVALDAMALSEEVMEVDLESGDGMPEDPGVTGVIPFFVNS